MRPPPLRDRILSALALAPMTAGELSRCLGSRASSARAEVSRLRESGDVRIKEKARGRNGRPWNVLELAA